MATIPIIRLDSIDSTSTQARRLVEGDAVREPFVVVARTQTGGRGQFSRAWASPDGGLWCTLAYAADRVGAEGLGVRVGLACARTVEGALRRAGNGNDVRLKWPNDVYVLNKKILGVLTESIGVSGRRVILVGVGVNANFLPEQLPPDIAPRATTILERTGSPTDLSALLRELIANMERAVHLPRLDSSELAEARMRLHAVGAPAEVRVVGGEVVRGVLKGLDDTGRPVVVTERGEVTGVSMDPAW